MEQNKLTPEEIVRVFAMYWDTPYSFPDATGNPYIVNKSCGDTLDNIIRKGIEERMLLLTPLSAMSDEHRERIDHLNLWECYNQLVLWGYAVPLWFGIEHWANNKTAIELNIAKDKTKEETSYENSL